MRLEGDDHVYRTSEWLSFRTAPLDYVQKQIVELPRDDLAEVTVQTSTGEYVIQSPKKGEIELQGVPDGKQVKGTEDLWAVDYQWIRLSSDPDELIPVSEILELDLYGKIDMEVGNSQAAHGRAPAVAMGHKVANPDSIVISYQGDGDLASIGMGDR